MSFRGGHRHARAHPAPAFGLADQPPTKRMRTAADSAQNNYYGNDATSSTTRAGSASPFPPPPSGGPPASNNGQHPHPSFIISPERDCRFDAVSAADGQHAPAARYLMTGSSDSHLNSWAPPAAALLFGAAAAAPAASELGHESEAVMKITQDSVSDIDEPLSSTEQPGPAPREWWKQRPATETASAAAAAPTLSASSSFSSLAPHGAAAAVTRCHVCNVNEAPLLSSSDVGASAGPVGGGAQYPWHLNGSPFVANGPHHHPSPAFTNGRHHGNYQGQSLLQMQTAATTVSAPVVAAAAPTKQKNSLLSYFQVRKPPAASSTPSRPPSSTRFGPPAQTPPVASNAFSPGAHSSMTPHPQTGTAHQHSAGASAPPSVLACSYCERPSCPSCTRHCQSCSKRYCTFCSTVNYDESREERVFCLDCHHDAHAVAIGSVAEASHHGCMDMEE